MPDSIPDDTVTTSSNLFLSPLRAPHFLERLAGVCLRAEADDSRLGDLSEQYVRSHARTRSHLGDAPWAMAASHLAADLHYVFAATNVMLFARAVDPGWRLAETGITSLIALDLRERTMSMIRFAAHKLVLPAVLLICSALLINSAADVWRNWRQTQAMMASLQREKAEAAAQRVESFVREVERQIGWVAGPKWTQMTVDQRRFDYVRLLRQVPAITALTQLDGNGHEQLVVSRLAMDVVGSDVDRSAEPAFIKAMEGFVSGRPYWAPVYRKQSDPHTTVATPHGMRSGVTVAEVNLKPVWDAINAVKLGDTGYGYIVDGTGRLIAYHDSPLVLRETNLSALPQVAAALSAPPSAEPIEGKTLDNSAAVTSVNMAIPALGWRVFVDLPTSETRAALWGTLLRAGALLLIGLMAAFLAIRTAVRPFIGSAQPASA